MPELTEWKKSKAELEARIASMPADPLDMGAPELVAWRMEPRRSPLERKALGAAEEETAFACGTPFDDLHFGRMLGAVVRVLDRIEREALAT